MRRELGLGVPIPTRRDGAWIKAQRLQAIARMIAKTFPKGVSYDRMVSLVELEIGLSTQKAREYIDKVIEAKGWRVEDGIIKPGVEGGD